MADISEDQASGLRRMRPPRPVQVIAVTGGKGGVGKTSVSVNLAMAMAMAGKQTMLLDGDLGLANVDVMLGLQPSFNLSHVISGECSLAETIITGPHGLMVVPAASGKRHMAELTPMQHAGLVHAFSELRSQIDVMVIDTAAGLSDSVLTLTQAAQQVIVVVTNDPSSITDAYALIKVLSREQGVDRIHVLTNMVHSARDAQDIFESLRRVAERFLNVTLLELGSIPQDEWLQRAVRQQRAVVDAYPNCRAAAALRQIAGRAMNWSIPAGARGNLEFFVERLVHGVAS